MERENQRIVITKRMLKEGILKLLKEKALDAINVTELCREAGVNRATFYRHYQIPRDVLMEIQRDLYRQLRQQVGIPKTTEEIRPAIEALCQYLYEQQELIRLLIRSNSDTDFANFMDEIYLELAVEYGGMGILKQLNQEDIRLLMLYSTGGSYFILRNWVLGSIDKSPREMADCVCGLMDKTRQLINGQGGK